nr:aspyridones efflux protein apdf [Quercus suber]
MQMRDQGKIICEMLEQPDAAMVRRHQDPGSVCRDRQSISKYCTYAIPPGGSDHRSDWSTGPRAVGRVLHESTTTLEADTAREYLHVNNERDLRRKAEIGCGELDINDWPVASDCSVEQAIYDADHPYTCHGQTDLGEKHGNRSGALTRSLTSRSHASSWRDPGPPPDGGLVAWTQCFLVHLTVFSTWGYVSSFGTFQTYYQTTLNVSPSAISWLGSTQIFLLFFIGTFSGRALDAGLFFPTYVTGSVLQLLGIFSTSFAKTYWQLFLSQALCTGFANGLHFCPTMSLLTTYFAKKRSFAVGLAALGSCTGGIVFPVIVQQLLPKVGFPWTVRVIGFVMLVTNVVTISLYRPRLPPRKSGPLIEWSSFREPPYLLYCIGMFFTFWGLYFAFFYIGMYTHSLPVITIKTDLDFVGSYGRNVLGLSYQKSVDLLLTIVSIGIPFRIIPNFFADKIGPLNAVRYLTPLIRHAMLMQRHPQIIPFGFLCGIMLFGWIGVHTTGALFAFATIYGIGSAGSQSLFAATLSSLTDDLSKAGVRMGMGFSIVSFACLTGPPLSGALIQINGGSFLYAQM